MNKFLIVLLAVCLVSVHAFVKREAETPKEQNFLDSAVKSIQESTKEAAEKLSEVLNPEKIQKDISEMLENLSNAFKDSKSDSAKPQ